MALIVRNLKVKVERKEILRGVDLRIKAGEVVALMGPNGSGKSSLAYALMGHPDYRVIKERGVEMSLDGVSLLGKTVDERAKRGLFLAFQYPVAIEGVSVGEVLLSVLGRLKGRGENLRKRIKEEALGLQINKELLNRDLNSGFSGGEKKKMELLQLRILEPKYAILDETDSGLDIDALRLVAAGARRLAEGKRTGVLVVTHYRRILEYLKPNRVLIMDKGRIVKEGGLSLVKELEKRGYGEMVREREE